MIDRAPQWRQASIQRLRQSAAGDPRPHSMVGGGFQGGLLQAVTTVARTADGR